MMSEEVQVQTESAPSVEQEQAEQTYSVDGQEFTSDEFRNLAQKGMFMESETFNQRLDDIRVAAFNEIAAEHGVTPEEYWEMTREKREQEELLSPIKAENEKYRQQQQAEEEKAQQQENFNQFNEYFNEINGRNFDAQRDELPAEVLASLEQGTPLQYAYLEFVNNDLRQQIKEVKEAKQQQSKPKQGIDRFLQGFDSF